MRITRNTVLRAALAAIVLPVGVGAQDLPISGLQPSPDQPPTRQGTRGANFLQLGVGARANAMAGAVASLVEGPTSWYWNPAGAASTETFSVSATRSNLYQDLGIVHNFAGITLPFAGGAFGISFVSLNSGDIDRTDEESPRADNPTLGGSFTWGSSAIGAGYARRLTDRLDLGVHLKYVTEGINDADVKWMAVDLGTQFRTGIYGLNIGASIQNIGPASRMSGPLLKRRIDDDNVSNQVIRGEFDTRDLELPTLFRFSVGSDLYGRASSLLGSGGGRQSLTGELAFNDAIDTDVQMAMGLEYGFADRVFVRLGKRFYNDDRAATGEGQTSNNGTYGLSGGLGLRLPLTNRALKFDYAYTALGDLQNVQVFSFEFGR